MGGKAQGMTLGALLLFFSSLSCTLVATLRRAGPAYTCLLFETFPFGLLSVEVRHPCLRWTCILLDASLGPRPRAARLRAPSSPCAIDAHTRSPDRAFSMFFAPAPLLEYLCSACAARRAAHA